MSITRNFQESIAEKSQQDPKIAEVLFDDTIYKVKHFIYKKSDRLKEFLSRAIAFF